MQFEHACRYILEKLRTGLPAEFTYHNATHTLDVSDACGRLAEFENISDTEKMLLLTAACYHDCGFLVKSEGHEEESCKIAVEILPQFSYSATDIKAICGMIRATRIPQTPQNHLEQIIADADLDYLGRDDFEELSQKLFLELKARGLAADIDQWNRTQIAFLEQHIYFTPTAACLRNAGKEAHLLAIKSTIVPDIHEK